MAEPKRPWPKRPSPKRPSPKRPWPKRPTFEKRDPQFLEKGKKGAQYFFSNFCL